jgi:undecaprenyl diphosphate synthase|tara:strand:- start:99 stop:827 length:729 start_codon:yes stop_codon:yes gene_type:complete
MPGFGAVPKHIAMVMDGNGRWANERGLTRTEGHRAGEAALLEAVAGATSAGVENLTAYAFSTENWKRSTDEVKFLMGYNKDVLRRRRDLLMDWNVRIRWSGEERKLWPSVVRELRIAEEMTKNNTGLVLTMAVNYGGRQEIVAAVNKILQEIRTGGAAPKSINEKTIQKRLYVPELPDVDMFLRSSGEMRISNFMLWQSSYAEMIFMDVLWPDFTRESLWEAISEFGRRQRRFGGASDAPLN